MPGFKKVNMGGKRVKKIDSVKIAKVATILDFDEDDWVHLDIVYFNFEYEL